MKGYYSRMLRSGAGRPERQVPLPTKADFCAMIYDQDWASVTTPQSSTNIFVLALTPDHARHLGQMRLTALYQGPRVLQELRLLQNTPRPYTDAEALQALLDCESPDERDDRHRTFERGGFGFPAGGF